MIRLTLKEYVNERIANVKNYIEFNERKDNKDFFAHKELELYQKAQKYIELTDDLGCPLEVREKAFDNGFYDADGNHYICEHYVPYLKSMHTRGIMRGREKHFNLEDYKKTWWLSKTKEE